MRKTFAAVLAAALAAAGAALAHGYTVGDLKIGHPWSLPSPAGAPTAAGYLTLTNTGKAPERLLGADIPDVARVEIHQMSMNGGVMRMRAVSGGLLIGPGQTVTLAPGGYHLMLIGPKHPFAVGDHVMGTLRFEHAGSVKVDFHVQADPPKGEAEVHAGMAPMDHH